MMKAVVTTPAWLGLTPLLRGNGHESVSSPVR